MRRKNKEIRDPAVIEDILLTAPVGRLGTTGRDGYPMVKPLNFAYAERAVYFHSAPEGEKIEDIARNARVCFETDIPIALVKSAGSPCRAEYLYRSVIIKGIARVVNDEAERLRGLMLLMKKYQPEGGYGEFPREKLAITSVVKIEIEEMTGKEDLGDGGMREAVLRALEEKRTLPFVLMRTE